MLPTNNQDSIEVENKEPLFEKEIKKFSSFYSDDLPLEEKSEEPIFDPPYVAPLTPPQTSYVLNQFISYLEPPLQILIKPLPNIIETCFQEGLTKTTLTVVLPSSEKVEVVIKQYDTSQNAYHISFYSSEQLRDLIASKQDQMLKILQTALPNLSFAISPPFIDPPSFLLPKTKRFGYCRVNKGKDKK